MLLYIFQPFKNVTGDLKEVRIFIGFYAFISKEKCKKNCKRRIWFK